MALSINVGEQSTITAAQVAQEAGQTADLTLMRFNASQAIPGMVRAGGTETWATELAGAPSTAGTYTLQADLVDAGTSYGAYTADVVVVGSEPDPDPDPEPEHHPLAARLAAYLRLPGDPGMLQLADTHLPIVEAFVHGYTRGRGFGEDGRPEAPLEAVVISATARLSANPEQVTAYTAGDYSEKSAVLAGWTLPEQAVLHRYRRRTNRAATAAEASELNKLNAELLAPYALTADVVASLSSYATLEDVPDLDPYALKSEIPAEPDLTPYVTETELSTALDPYALSTEIPAEPDLSGYLTKAGAPALLGLRRSEKYVLSAGTTVAVPDADSPRSASVWLMIDGDIPGPVWFQVYRAGTYNKAVPVIAPASPWRVDALADPGVGTFRLWVDGNGAGASIMVKNTAGYGRNFRLYWFDI